MARLLLAERAIDDLADIEAYSIETWGQATADRYIDGVSAAFDLLKASPDLLKPRDDFSGRLLFYRVERHWLVCDRFGETIVVLTVAHGAMDIHARLARLEPTLIQEAELMARRYLDRD